jgi:hypothetical protein
MTIELNQKQLASCDDWAADDRLWTTQETVAFNLKTFARVILRDCRNPLHARVGGTPEPHEIGSSCMAESLSETVSPTEKLVTCKGQPEPHMRIHACREPIVED